MTKQRRQAVGMWAHDVTNDEWDPWDGSIRASGCALSSDGHGHLVTATTTAYETHLGHMFRLSHLVPDDAQIGDNASQGVCFTTCAKELHITFQVLSGGDAEMRLYENHSACTDGDSASVFNMNRSSCAVSSASKYVNPTVDPGDFGTLIAATFIPGGTGPKSGGGGGEVSQWLFSASNSYLITAINRGGGDKPMSITAQWHEEDPD